MAYIDKNTGLIVPGNAPGGDIDLSFITAGAEHILEGKVGSDTNGRPVYGSLVPASGGGMDFYKCAAVYGPRTVTRITVSNAGTAAVNGDYEKTTLTTSSGYEVWKHMTADYYLYRLYQYTWSIHSDYTTEPYQALYYCESEDPTSGSWSTGYDYSTDTATGTTPVPSVSKFQVTLDEDVPKTWDGYKAVLTDGIYDFETKLTTGLTYGTSYVPVVGGIYSADALVQVSGLFDNIVNNFPGGSALFAIDSNVGENDIIGGTAPTLYGEGTVLQNNEFCFDHVRALDYTIGESMSSLGDFTIEMDYTITSDTTGYCGFFGNKKSWSTMNIQIQWGRSGYRPAMFWNDYFDTNTGGAEHPEWVNDGVYHHVAMVKKGEVVTLYSDGVKIADYSGATKSLNLAIENLLAVGTQHVENSIFPGRMKHFRVIGSAIYDGDFDMPEWVGKGDSSGGDTSTPEITVSTPVTLTGTQNVAMTNIQLTATVSDNGTPTFTSTDLPEGLTLSNSGLISGTPTGSGQGTSTITVSYDGAESKTITLNWTIESASETVPEGAVMKLSGFPIDGVNGYYSLYSEGTYSNGGSYFIRKATDRFGSPDMFWTIFDATETGWYQAQTGGVTADNPWDFGKGYWYDLGSLEKVSDAIAEAI